MIAPLLEALRAKDPATWKRFDGLELATYKQYDDYGTTENYIYQEDLIAPVRMAWLQAVLQEACQARGWASALTYNPPCGPDAPFWGAHVWPDDRCSAGKKADSPAEALLSCYLEAIG